jgi:hypothetical protein
VSESESANGSEAERVKESLCSGAVAVADVADDHERVGH